MAGALVIGMAPSGAFRDIAAKLLQPALDHGSGESWEDVERELDADRAQLWLIAEGTEPMAAAVTRLTEDGCVEFWLCGGRDMKHWLDALIDTVGRGAREQGCTKMRLIGRKGWARSLPDWRLRGVILERAL